MSVREIQGHLQEISDAMHRVAKQTLIGL